jgi:lysophospholipase L1-like esterase
MFEPDWVIIQLNQGDFTTDPFDSQANFHFVQTATGFELKKNEAYVSGNPITSRFAQFQKMLNLSAARVLVARLAKLGARSAKTPAQPSAQETAEQLKAQEALITWVVRELKAHYPKLLLLYIPTIDYFGDQAPSSVELQLAQAVRAEGVPFVSVHQDYIDAFQMDRRAAHGFDNTQPGVGHINALGHALLAERLAEMMKQLTLK